MDSTAADDIAAGGLGGVGVVVQTRTPGVAVRADDLAVIAEGKVVHFV